MAYDERGLVPCVVQDASSGEVLTLAYMNEEALQEIKADESLRRIPIVVLTTSKDEADVLSTYDLGVSSFITKPVTFGGLVDVMRTWTQYWFEIVEVPEGAEAAEG